MPTLNTTVIFIIIFLKEGVMDYSVRVPLKSICWSHTLQCDGLWEIIRVRLGYGEGNGTPLQYSCLENPMDGGAWWAAVHGVTQSRIRLKRLSSSSSRTLRKAGGCRADKGSLVFQTHPEHLTAELFSPQYQPTLRQSPQQWGQQQQLGPTSLRPLRMSEFKGFFSSWSPTPLPLIL